MASFARAHLEHFAGLGAQRVEIVEAFVLGELGVELGDHVVVDFLDGGAPFDVLAGDFFFAVVGGIAPWFARLDPGFGANQDFVETVREGILGDLEQAIINLGAGDRLVVFEGLEGGDDEIIFLDDGAALDLFEHPAPLAHPLELGVNFLFGDFDGRGLHLRSW